MKQRYHCISYRGRSFIMLELWLKSCRWTENSGHDVTQKIFYATQRKHAPLCNMLVLWRSRPALAHVLALTLVQFAWHAIHNVEAGWGCRRPATLPPCDNIGNTHESPVTSHSIRNRRPLLTIAQLQWHHCECMQATPQRQPAVAAASCNLVGIIATASERRAC